MYETMHEDQENVDLLNNPEVEKIAQEAEKLTQHLEYISWLDKENKRRFLSEVMGAGPDEVERRMKRPEDIYYAKEENICIYCQDLALLSDNQGTDYWKKATVAYGNTDSRNFLDKTGVDPKLVFLSAAVGPIKYYFKLLGQNTLEYYYKLSGQNALDKMKTVKMRFTVSYKDTSLLLSTSGGSDMIDIETKYYEDFFKNALNGSVEKFKSDYEVLEAKFFHEYVHMLSVEEYGNDSREEYTQMAEFLWNPTTDIFKDHFSIMKKHLPRNVKNDTEEALFKIYGEPFIKVTSKILLNELYDRGVIGKLDTREKVLEVYSNLDKYYEAIDKEERINILAKYLKININSLKDEINNITEKLGLPY